MRTIDGALDSDCSSKTNQRTNKSDEIDTRAKIATDCFANAALHSSAFVSRSHLLFIVPHFEIFGAETESDGTGRWSHRPPFTWHRPTSSLRKGKNMKARQKSGWSTFRDWRLQGNQSAAREMARLTDARTGRFNGSISIRVHLNLVSGRTWSVKSLIPFHGTNRSSPIYDLETCNKGDVGHRGREQ